MLTVVFKGKFSFHKVFQLLTFLSIYILTTVSLMVRSKQVNAANKFNSSSCMHLENIVQGVATNIAHPKMYFESVHLLYVVSL